jgi:hypothetical protein
MRHLLTAAGLALLLAAGTAGAAEKPRKVVLLAGPLDKGHPRGTHEYEKSVRLLAHCLSHSPDAKGIVAEAHAGGWPADPRTLDDADTIVLIASGSDRRESDHPFLVGDRLSVIERQMKRGCGLVLIHWCVFVPKEKAGDRVLDWVGGYFDYESGPKPRGWYSRIQTATTRAVPVAASAHPISRGLSPFSLREEYYYRIRFRERDKRLTPILTTAIPGEKEVQTVAWAVQRPGGGRGFGFTGGHFFDNWQVEPFRKMVLNAVAWTAHAEVPETGIRSTLPAEAELGKIHLGGTPSVKGEGAAPKAHLVEGKFGKALDAASTPLAFTGDRRYRTLPLTVECWARLHSKRGFNVLVSCDAKSSSRHWEVYSYARSGAFSAYLPGWEPSEIVSKTNICDDKWHYLAMTFDGKRVGLFVDGKQVVDQEVKSLSRPRAEVGPLSIGQAIDGSGRIGCDGLIDDVRLSRIVRKINAVPTAPLPVDADTIGVWRFDDSESILADPAWTPPPATTGEAWERATDVDWIDPRLRTMDTGPTFNATMRYKHGRGQVTVYKATAIRIGERGQGAVIFDRARLRLAAGWTGAFLNHSDTRFGLLNTPTPAGTLAFTTASNPGWADPKGKWEAPSQATLPLPAEWGRFSGMHLHGKRVVLSYTVAGVEVRESPWLETIAGQDVFLRTIEVGPSKTALHLLAGELPGKVVLTERGGVPHVTKQQGERAQVIFLLGADRQARLVDGGGPRVAVHLPAAETVRRFQIAFWSGPDKERDKVVSAVSRRVDLPDLKAWTKAGPARWTKPIVTRGEVAADNAPWVVDTLTLPYDNPHKALFFATGLDFLPSGDIALCTAHGDVWLVRGADRTLDKITWKRFATGLYQPLGLKVVDGKIVVLERGQLTRLHDLDGDGEADLYESLCNDWHTGSGEHSYDTCLETDPEGRFYFFKTGDPHLPHGGCLLRFDPRRGKVEVFATGFRHPIGLSVSPTGGVTGADQEGNWMPATRIDVYRKGGFYGDMRAHHRTTAPTIYDQPLLWLPKSADNSAGGQVWVPHDHFGFPKGQLLHLSYGRCKLYAILPQTVGDVQQAGAVDLGLFFLSGAMRGRFRPGDGHLYVCGLNGWQTAARRDGCLQRVRFTGMTPRIPTALSVRTDGIHLRFACKLDATRAVEKGRWRVEQWNYRWSGDYGSKDWSVRQPDREGHDTLTVTGVTLAKDGQGVFLQVEGLREAMQTRIGYDVLGADGKSVVGAVHNTIHRLAPPQRRQGRAGE